MSKEVERYDPKTNSRVATVPSGNTMTDCEVREGVNPNRAQEQRGAAQRQRIEDKIMHNRLKREEREEGFSR